MIRNNSNLSRTPADGKKRINPEIGILFIVLIIVQFYLVPLIALAASEDLNNYKDYLYLYTITSFTIIVLGIIIFHDKGLDVFQDHFSLWTIVLACFWRLAWEKKMMLFIRSSCFY